jgi:hypothetical protein
VAGRRPQHIGAEHPGARHARGVAQVLTSARVGQLALALAGFSLTIVAYHPGELTFDSIWQYNQAVAHSYTDHHPPVMAWLWSVLDRAVHGPLGMLVLQAGLMWSALLLIADGARRRGMRHGWLVVAVGFLPPILGIEGEIWKDVQMASSLLLAFALVYRGDTGHERMRAVWGYLALIPLFYAVAIRANAIAAVAPIAVYWAYRMLRGKSLSRSLAVAMALMALMLGAQAIVDRLLLDARRDYLSQFLTVFDIAAIQCAGGDATIPAAFLRSGVSGAAVCEAFDPYKVDFLFAPEGAPLTRTADREVMAALRAAWLRAIAANPTLYASHRMRAFGALLGVGTDYDDVRRPVWIPSSIPNAYGFAFAPNVVTHAIGVSVAAARAARLFDGIPWLLLAIVSLTLWRRWHRELRLDGGAAVLALSALTYALPYVFIAIAPDYRYLYWTVIASAVAAVLLVLSAPPFAVFTERRAHALSGVRGPRARFGTPRR